jgi:acyl-CoA thioesterase-1
MKKLITFLLLVASTQVHAFDILAFGTSTTNCRGVARDRIFPVKLEELLKQDGFDVHVINAGVDGDKPVWMLHRLKSSITPNVKMVILEPGPNERNPDFALPYIEKLLGYLQEINMPTLFTSHMVLQTEQQGQAMAEQFGVYYYGGMGRNIPIDRVHRQFDYPSTWGGHMTAEGCEAVARNMAPLIEKIIVDKQLK